MKKLYVVCLAIMLLIASPFFILFFGGVEFYRLFNDALKTLEKRLSEDS